MARWEDFARDFLPAEMGIDKSALRDNIAAILKLLRDKLDEPLQHDARSSPSLRDTATSHAEHRYLSGFNSLEILSEFVALRERVLHNWLGDRYPSPEDFRDMRNFNRALDELISECLARYSEDETKGRALFLGTLIHDLKNPLNSILQASHLLPMVGDLNDKQKHLASQIGKSSVRINGLVTTLIDSTRIRLGKGMPLNPAPMDIGQTAHEVIEELKSAYPSKELVLKVEGDARGSWDPVRCEEVISNLVANSVQHGDGKAAVTVTITGHAEDVVLSVHNWGMPIPDEQLLHIFDPLRATPAKTKNDKMSLGLGLFIARAIMLAHKGSLSVTSNAEAGTTFTAAFPRTVAPKAEQAPEPA